jgi:hypothetical protein
LLNSVHGLGYGLHRIAVLGHLDELLLWLEHVGIADLVLDEERTHRLVMHFALKNSRLLGAQEILEIYVHAILMLRLLVVHLGLELRLVDLWGDASEGGDHHHLLLGPKVRNLC